MNTDAHKIKVSDPVLGFTEREPNSKAILNTDIDSLLKYKIQKRKFSDINKSKLEIERVKEEINDMKNDLTEIKSLLIQISQRPN